MTNAETSVGRNEQRAWGLLATPVQQKVLVGTSLLLPSRLPQRTERTAYTGVGGEAHLTSGVHWKR